MANPTSLQQLLKSGDVHSQLVTCFNNGDFIKAEDMLKSLLNSSDNHFDPNEPSFTLKFPSQEGEVELLYSSGKVSLKELKKEKEDASLTGRIKNGTAPIEEIERSLAVGDLNYREFKEAAEHLKPHVSEFYKLLLAHEGEVYETQNGPAIKVDYSNSSIYVKEELTKEKEKREEAKNARQKDKGHENLNGKEIKSILNVATTALSLDDQLKNDRDILLISKNLANITDPEEMQSLVGNYAHLGIYITIDNGKLAILNKENILEHMQDNLVLKDQVEDAIEDIHQSLDNDIALALGKGNVIKAGELFVHKDEIELYVAEQIKEGVEPEKAVEQYVEKEIKGKTEKVLFQQEVPTISQEVSPEQNIENLSKTEQLEYCKNKIKQLCVNAGPFLDAGPFVAHGSSNVFVAKFIAQLGKDGSLKKINSLRGKNIINDNANLSLQFNERTDENGEKTTETISETIHLENSLTKKINKQ